MSDDTKETIKDGIATLLFCVMAGGGFFISGILQAIFGD